jgi:hypothetical protein
MRCRKLKNKFQLLSQNARKKNQLLWVIILVIFVYKFVQVEQNSAEYAQLHDNLQNMQMQNLHLQEIAQNLVRFEMCKYNLFCQTSKLADSQQEVRARDQRIDLMQQELEARKAVAGDANSLLEQVRKCCPWLRFVWCRFKTNAPLCPVPWHKTVN